MDIDILDKASLLMEFTNENKEIFVAQWILQNPTANIDDYALVYRDDYRDGFLYRMFSIEKKGE